MGVAIEIFTSMGHLLNAIALRFMGGAWWWDWWIGMMEDAKDEDE